VLWSFTYIKEKILRENYKEAYKLWGERNPVTRMNKDRNAFLNQKNYSSKAKRITAVEIDEIKENITYKIGNYREEHNKRSEWRHNEYECYRAPQERPRKLQYRLW